MAYSLTCADTGADCPGHFTTSTKEELVQHAHLHAAEAHPGLELSSEQVDALVKQT